jgi:hypothetical protein
LAVMVVGALLVITVMAMLSMCWMRMWAQVPR